MASHTGEHAQAYLSPAASNILHVGCMGVWPQCELEEASYELMIPVIADQQGLMVLPGLGLCSVFVLLLASAHFSQGISTLAC